MASIWGRSCWQLGLAGTLTIGSVLALGDRAVTQTIVPDGTLGAENSTVSPNVLIRGILSDQIGGGAVRGINLFHSFSQFNVGENRGAYFTNPVGVENILTRVTGGTPSTILGRLGVLGGANLFLLNPGGILFGPNASLDVQGSFIASSSSRIELGTGFFSATEPATSSLLSVQPNALFLNALGSIRNQGNLAAGQNLRLVADTIDSSGQLTATDVTLIAKNALTVQTVNATTALLSTDQTLTVQTVNAQTATLSANNLLLTESQFNVTGNLSLLAQNQVTIGDSATNPLIAQVGGNLLIRGVQGINIQALNNPGSLISAGGSLTLESTQGVTANARFVSGGGFTIRAAGDIVLGDYQGAALNFSTRGNITLGDVNTSSATGNGGAVTLSTLGNGNITLGDINTSSATGNGGAVTLSTLGNGNISVRSIQSFSSNPNGGNGGAIGLTSATGNVTLTGLINATAISGNGGSVVLQAAAGSLAVRSIDGSSAGSGNGGSVTLSARNSFTTEPINTSSNLGNGGDIRLSSSGGAIDTSGGDLEAYSITGRGGAVSLTANGDLKTASIDTSSDSVSGGNISLTSSTGAIDTTAGILFAPITTVNGGNGGGITLQAANNIRVGTLRSDGGNQGSGGPIRINSDRGNITVIPNQAINSSTFGVGTAGDIVLTGDSLLLDGASLDASTNAAGNGGSVVLTARNQGAVTISNTQINTTVKKSDATGAGGNVAITGGAVFLSNSKIDASTYGAGRGGSIAINAVNGGLLNLDGSTLSSDTTTAGSGGNIGLTAQTIALSNNSRISARTRGSGQGGNVFVKAMGNLTLASSSRISTAVDLTATGNGGDIDVTAQSLSLTAGARLEALTRGPGDAGNIQITAPGLIEVTGANPYGLYSGLLTSSEVSNSGRGGNITINSRANPQGTLRVADGAFLSARTLSSSAGGNVEVNVNHLVLIGGGQLITSGFNSGTAGNITVNATQSTTLSGSNPNFNGSSGGAAPSLNGSGQITEVEPNNTIAQAHVLPTASFSLQANPAIELATAIPHITVTAGGDGTFDYYAFSVETPDSRGIFDIDTGPNNLDTQLFLFDQAGNLLDSNDDAAITAGAGGSTDSFNSYLNYSFTAPGTYVLGVGLYPSTGNNGGQTPISGEVLAQGSNYQLQVSIETNRTFNPNEAAASGLFAQSRGTGAGGTLTITTPQLLVQDGAQVTVNNTGLGNAGNLDVSAQEVTLNNGSKLSAETVSGGGGNIQLRQLEALQLSNNSQISASTVNGQGGTLSISASRSIDLNNGSGLFARAAGDGTAGNLTLSAQQLTVQNGSEISTSTAGRGSAGQVELQADSLFLNNGGKITSRSTGAGNAGSITLNLRDRLRSSAGEISASSEQGGGGSIALTARDILLRNSSLISTNVVSGSGGGGNITITANDIFIALEDSDILANAADGIGGSIDIKAPVFIADIFANVGQNPGKDFSRFRGNGRVDISASSRFGVSGIVTIPDFTFLQNSLDRLSENFVTPEQIVAGSCLVRRNVERGSFIAVGTGGLPDDPYGVVKSRYSLVGVQTLAGQKTAAPREDSPRLQAQIQNLQAKIPASSWKPGDPVQEAQGLMQTIDGRVVLGTDAQLAEIAKAQELICGDSPERLTEKPF
ncbi:MAG: filamentous hemagglutinin N-terminal domain-containing protein [Kovacikia sp.]